MATPNDVGAAKGERSTDELRREMYRILDEVCDARAERAAKLKAQFDELWKQLPVEETIH